MLKILFNFPQWFLQWAMPRFYLVGALIGGALAAGGSIYGASGGDDDPKEEPMSMWKRQMKQKYGGTGNAVAETLQTNQLLSGRPGGSPEMDARMAGTQARYSGGNLRGSNFRERTQGASDAAYQQKLQPTAGDVLVHLNTAMTILDNFPEIGQKIQDAISGPGELAGNIGKMLKG
jgi:hypothetical protein